MKKTGNKNIIHGHVPNSYMDIENALSFHDNHISIDGGCVYSHIHALNHLIALEINSGLLYLHKNID